MKSIETVHAGVTFRSRLEARWAVFFDALGVGWEYEPEGYSLPSGNYLPDFRLQLADTVWFEVKPVEGWRGNDTADSRWQELADATQKRVFTAYGMPRPETLNCFGAACGAETGKPQIHLHWLGYWDLDYSFCVCKCGAVGIEHCARAERVCGDRCWPGEVRDFAGDRPRIKAAYQRAISTRSWVSPVTSSAPSWSR